MDQQQSPVVAAMAAAPIPPRRSIVAAMAERFGMESAAFEQTLLATVMPKSATRENVAAFLVVAHEHGLNPFTREVFAFEGQGGGIRPIVSIDGWIRLVNQHPACDGFDLIDLFEADRFVGVEARFYRKDRTRPVVVREYLAECKRNTDPWTRWPQRMTRHKAFIQGARLAFGFAGLEDEDEFERREESVRTERRAEPEIARIDLSRARPGVAVNPAGGAPIRTVHAEPVESDPAAQNDSDHVNGAEQESFPS